ncbi:MAG: VPEID-CTERM sorting domain-containing protein [Bryobacteraceae bacterium]
MKRTLGFATLAAAVAASAMASVVNTVPEIDASTGAAALALVSGAYLVLTSRRNR